MTRLSGCNSCELSGKCPIDELGQGTFGYESAKGCLESIERDWQAGLTTMSEEAIDIYGLTPEVAAAALLCVQNHHKSIGSQVLKGVVN